ncbi:MAG: amino acid adenylation domain-containing protein, partial [bacterium]|nr:amino acid adenylation domain-containing protein [bacterium]
AYWKEQLAGLRGDLELPTDRPRPHLPTYRGALCRLALPQPLTEALKALSRQQGSTLFMTLLAAWNVLLHTYAQQDDVAVGSPIANRNHSEIEGLIGFFVNTLLLRTHLAGGSTYRELLTRVREAALGAYAHQDLPFEKLVAELEPERHLSRQPLFQVMMVLQNAPASEPELPGLTVNRLEVPRGISHFDLTLLLREIDGTLFGGLEYSSDLFDASTARRMLGHFRNLLEAIVDDPGKRLAELSLLSVAERHQLLAAWNDAARRDGPQACVHELFEAQVARTPEAVAVVFGDRRLSYRELDRRCNRLASHLGVGPEVTVAVALERSLEAVEALIAVVKAGGVFVPLDRSYPEERLELMLRDSGAEILVTSRESLDHLPGRQARTVVLDADREAIARASDQSPASGVVPDHPAYLIYTSGSTGRPKGVAMVHRALSNLVEWQLQRPGFAAGARTVQFASMSFDVSLQEVFSTLASGGSLHLLSEDLRRDPAGLAALLDAQRIERLFLPFVALQQLAEAAAENPPDALREVITAGEQLQTTRQVERFFTELPSCTLENQYGPSESHVVTAHALAGAAAEWPALPPIGRAVANFRVYLLNAHRHLVPRGVAGEIFLSGVGLARGYYQRPERTAEKFLPDPYRDQPGERMYATGDLGRLTPDGEIEFLGRIDHQVKIRGFRIELGEIEAVLSRHPAVREAVVAVREQASAPESPGDKRLVAYLVAHRAPIPAADEMRDHLLAALPDYMVPSVFVELEALPLTPSGKVNRRALPAPEPGAGARPESYVAPRGPLEELVAGIWSQVLGATGPASRVGAHDNFFALGGHSLLATRVVSRIRTTCDLELPLVSLFEAPTVAGLAARVEERMRAGDELPAPPIHRVPRDGDLPLSFAQERLWFLDLYEPGSPVYNVPVAYHLTGRLSPAALAASLRALVRRHETLRTTFRDGPRQHVAAELKIDLPRVDLRRLPDALRQAVAAELAREEARRPFELARGPVLRAALLRLGEEQHRLLLVIHHIAFDGWSAGIFMHELGVLYRAAVDGRPSPLPALRVQYADFAVWQRHWLAGPARVMQLAYWRERLRDLPVLELPTDRPRPAQQTFRGAAEAFALPAALGRDLRELARQHGTTLFMTLLAAFQLLLGRASRQRDFAVGSPVANRNRAEIEALVGFFVNTLVLRVDLRGYGQPGEPTFGELAARVREVALGAYAHQDLPFEQLVEELRPQRDLSHGPLAQVMFVFQNAPMAPPELGPGLAVSREPVSAGTAKFDLTLSLEERDGTLRGGLGYNRDLFDRSRIVEMLAQYAGLLEQITADPEAEITSYSLVTAAAGKLLPQP